MVAQFHGVMPPPTSNRKRKFMWIAYALLLLLGGCGAHRFYVGAYPSALMLLGIGIASAVLASFNLSFGAVPAASIAGLLLVLWLMVDLVLLARLVKRHNQR